VSGIIDMVSLLVVACNITADSLVLKVATGAVVVAAVVVFSFVVTSVAMTLVWAPGIVVAGSFLVVVT